MTLPFLVVFSKLKLQTEFLKRFNGNLIGTCKLESNSNVFEHICQRVPVVKNEVNTKTHENIRINKIV